jgi:hypothetical protein
VFNRTIVPEPAADKWYKDVRALPSDRDWQAAFTARFGRPPAEYTDLYYDAANLLFDRIEQVAQVDGRGSLTISRPALAAAVRNTTGFLGVSCTVSFDQYGNRVLDKNALAKCR